MTLDTFTQAYISCCFEETIEEGPHGQDGYGPIGDDFSAEDIDPSSLERIVADCTRFQAENKDDIATWSSEVWSDTPAMMGGRSFAESRNWCGGFLGGDWPEPVASRLAAAARAYGPTVTHISDAGVVSIGPASEDKS
jgi:hypothetical protein